jgi:tRNA nucleotidyltransferase (CCA-adding enzyme)
MLYNNEKEVIMDIKAPPMINSIVNRVEQAGGKALLVGGAVIDVMNNRRPKDWDIEVFGLSFARLEDIFSDKGAKMVGRQFGILKLAADKCDGLDVDLNVPRRDNHIGKGHSDLMVDLDPSMSFEEGCRRRDFSINAMAVNLSTGELIDPFGGRLDLSLGILRATDSELFVQDPLRALRAMQLLARKCGPHGRVEESTMNIIRGMSDAFSHLAKERVHEEFRKLLMKAESPSIGLQFLRDSGWISNFPELEALIECGQHPEWHPEGDVWTHSLHTVDSAAWVRDNESLPEGWSEAFMFGTMCHDVGKPATTVTPKMVADGDFPEERLWTAHGHDRAGIPVVESFLRRMTNEKSLIEKTASIVGEHMQPWNLFQGEAKKAGWRRLHNRIRLDVLGWMCKCDSCGGPHVHIGDPDFEHKTSEMCWDHFSEFGADPIEPILMGRHLIQAGVKPGEHFTPMLKAAFEAQLDNDSRGIDDLLKIALSSQGPE